MSKRIFATHDELAEALGDTLAATVWAAAAPDAATGTPSTDAVFAGAYSPADADLPAELNVSKALARIDALKTALKAVK